jgi:hypothetical protein
MTKSEFVSLPPIIATVLGREIKLVPTVSDALVCEYKSKRGLEVFIETPTGRIRCRLRFTISPVHFRKWSNA